MKREMFRSASGSENDIVVDLHKITAVGRATSHPTDAGAEFSGTTIFLAESPHVLIVDTPFSEVMEKWIEACPDDQPLFNNMGAGTRKDI